MKILKRIKKLISLYRFKSANNYKRVDLYRKKGLKAGERCQIFNNCSLKRTFFNTIWGLCKGYKWM